MELGKYMSILRFIIHYLKAILCKLTGYVVTPLVFQHRD